MRIACIKIRDPKVALNPPSPTTTWCFAIEWMFKKFQSVHPSIFGIVRPSTTFKWLQKVPSNFLDVLRLNGCLKNSKASTLPFFRHLGTFCPIFSPKESLFNFLDVLRQKCWKIPKGPPFQFFSALWDFRQLLTLFSIAVRICTTQDLLTSKGTSPPYGKENSWIRFSDKTTRNCTHFYGLLTWCLQNQKNGTRKIKKKLAQVFRFSCFFVWPLYNTGYKIRSKGP